MTAAPVRGNLICRALKPSVSRWTLLFRQFGNQCKASDGLKSGVVHAVEVKLEVGATFPVAAVENLSTTGFCGLASGLAIETT